MGGSSRAPSRRAGHRLREPALLTETTSTPSADTPAQAVGRPPGIWELAWPSILTSLLYSSVGIIAIRVVGELGPEAVAAVTLGTQVFFGMQAVMMAISVGTTALVARAWGAGDVDEAIRVAQASLVLGAGTSLALGIPCAIFAHSLAGIFVSDPLTQALAATFIRWQALFNWAFALNFIVATALRAAGDARSPLWVTGITNFLNIFLLIWFVHGGQGLPAMGIAGAAIANALALTLGGIAFMLLWVGGRFRMPFRLLNCLERRRIAQIVEIGVPAGAEQIVMRIGFFVFLGIIGQLYGTAPLAAYGVGVNILSVCFVVGFGFSIAGSTLVGQHLGAEDPDGAVRAGWNALALAIASMSAVGITIILLADPIARLLITDEAVIGYTVSFIWILGAVQPFMAVEFALGGALRGAGDTRFPLKATMVGLLVMRCGLALLFMAFGLPVEFIYGALIGDYLAKAAMLTLRFRSGRWKTVIPNERLQH